MTFEDYFTEAVRLGMNPDHRPAMMSAWDAALCAASAQAFEGKKLRTNHQIAATLSDLHSWAKPATPTTSL